MTRLSVFSPAKLNLFLAITGRRPDGFHDLVSLVVLLDWGDTLEVAVTPEEVFHLECDRPDLAVDDSNLVLRAARAFCARSGWRGGARFFLHKRIPLGAGLGGGSSNAVATLKALNQLTGEPLDAGDLLTLAGELGSDCPLFLQGGPVIMRGRGERLEPVAAGAAARLAGQRVLVFKPAFPIETAWAYRQLAERAAAEPGDAVYLSAPEAEAKLSRWLNDPAAVPAELLYNNLELPAFSKFLALPTLLQRLQEQHGWQARMSGSGSACFGFLGPDTPGELLQQEIEAAWGITAFCVQAGITTQTS